MKCVITPRGFIKNGQKELAKLQQLGIELDVNDTGKQYTPQQFAKKIRDADAVIIGVDLLGKDLLKTCSKLKLICKFGVGTDNIDVEYAQANGIIVKRTLNTNSYAVAEHCLTFMLAASKNLIRCVNEVKAGKWNKLTGFELHNHQLGIIGFGSIGQNLSKMAVALGMTVKVYDTYKISASTLEQYQVTQVGLDEIYTTSDFISLHVPLTESTRNLISKEQLSSMPSHCVLINAARGGIVNETDLIWALQEKRIQAAYFDVLEDETTLNQALIELDNFYLTPHIAARTVEADQNTCRVSAGFVAEVLLGKELEGWQSEY